MKLKAWLLCGLFILSASAQAAIVEGKDYVVLSKPVPALDAKKIEVTEFFSFTCVHCKDLDPILRNHAKTFPSDVRVRSEHIVWDDSTLALAKVQATINATNTQNVLSPLVFDAIFNKRINLADPSVLKDWIKQQKGFDTAKFLATYNSPKMDIDAKNMAKMTVEHNIDSTPRIIVGGKYEVRVPQQGGFVAAMGIIDELIVKVQKERTPAKKATLPKSKGGAYARPASL